MWLSRFKHVLFSAYESRESVPVWTQESLIRATAAPVLQQVDSEGRQTKVGKA